MFRRFARTIEVEVYPEEFVYRCGPRERRVPTRGYIKKVKDSTPSYVFQEQPATKEYVAVSLFSSLPPDLQEDIIDVLAAFLNLRSRAPVWLRKTHHRSHGGRASEHRIRLRVRGLSRGRQVVCFRRQRGLFPPAETVRK